MIKKKWFVFALVMIMALGLAGGVTLAEDGAINTEADFEVEYMAAPAVAGLLLEEAGIDNRYGSGPSGGNYIRDVAQHMGPETYFEFPEGNYVSKFDAEDYKEAIRAFLIDKGADLKVPFCPASLDDLVLWLNAGEGITIEDGKVSRWEDLSGQGNHATAEGDNRPTYNTSVGELNDQPAVCFDGIDTWLDAGEKIEPDEITMIAVFKPVDFTSNFQRIISRRSTTEGYMLSFGTGDDSDRMRTIIATDADNFVRADGSYLEENSPYLVVGTWDTSDLKMYLNGALDASAPGSGSITYKTDISLGIGGNPSDSAAFFNGDIAEILIFERPLDEDEREMVEAHLNEKYDIF